MSRSAVLDVRVPANTISSPERDALIDAAMGRHPAGNGRDRMIDPAVEAAQRAGSDNFMVTTHMERAAREALRLVREKHYRVTVDDDGAVDICATCWTPHGPAEWPCETAPLVYSTEELGRR